MHDKWFSKHVDYVDVFWTNIKKDTYFETIPACALLVKEKGPVANQHFVFLVESLAVYERELRDVAWIIRDNCLVNKSHEKICGVFLVESTSYK